MIPKTKIIPGITKVGYIDKDKKILENIQRVSRQRGSGDYDNMLPLVSNDIPPSVVISCPLARQHLRQAMQCVQCAFFNGVVQTAYNDEYAMSWDSKYAISCGFPVDRKCVSVCIEGGD